MNIPVVDFSPYNLRENNVLDEHIVDLGRQLKSSFTEVGFVYLKNTGITQEEVSVSTLQFLTEPFLYTLNLGENRSLFKSNVILGQAGNALEQMLVDHAMDISKTFFLQPDEMKLPFSRKSVATNPNHGWVSSETERLNPSRPGDLKESFNMSSLRTDIVSIFNIYKKWPSPPAFRDIQTAFFLRCQELSLRVLRVMAHSLGLEPQVFLHAHRYIGSDENSTTLRTLYYPPVNSALVKEGQLRCGEHSDYGSITLIFQSHGGGLQVLSRSGNYISAPSIPGTVLINIADLMQRWTSDYFISAVHRVLLPPAGDSSTRQCLAFFVQPDNEALITCCDGSKKYPPVKSGAYLMERFNDSYGRQ
ncbi:2-oxoglutarate-dependent dioxygenase htyE [Merluccius polli]|uniref:2-oxoglutarate-dependent dioxygenase htyE n=1 Tax=Merluccius polli TaxID=89951 RepID=A0AA47MK94_MERPO|nr:2-oxoglutarate-dependent dioxygenase htyE [Merluccius polli]